MTWEGRRDTCMSKSSISILSYNLYHKCNLSALSIWLRCDGGGMVGVREGLVTGWCPWGGLLVPCPCPWDAPPCWGRESLPHRGGIKEISMVDIMKSREEVEVEWEWVMKMRGGKGGECCQGKNIFPVILAYSRILQTLKVYSSKQS